MAAVPEPGGVNIEPTEILTLRPMGIGVEREKVGEVTLHKANFMLSPERVVVIVMEDGLKEALVRGLTGGVILT